MAEFKFFCPQCGQQIKCDTGYSGTQINCPACKQVITVPQAPGSAAQPPVPAKSRALKNVLVIAAAVIVLAGLVTAGWFGYSKYKRGHLPPGLVVLWPGEGNGQDLVGGNKVTLTDISFEEGKAGRAFSFNGTSSYLRAPYNPGMNIGNGDGFTFTAWIKPTESNGYHPIFRWSTPGSVPDGISLRIGHSPADRGVIYADFFNGNLYYLTSPPGSVASGKFQFVALTYDKATGQAMLYLNGTVVAQTQFSTPMSLETIKCDFYIGCEPPGSAPGSWSYNKYFAGLMDEIAVYNRALSADEIKNRWHESKSR
jgi:hypothetical protein